MCLGKTVYDTFPCLWSEPAVLNYSNISIKLQVDSNILASPEAGRGNCLPYVSVFQPVYRGTLVCRERSPGVSRKILEKKYLGTSKFAAFLREIQRERKSVSSCGNLLFFRDHHDFGRKLRNY